MLINQKLKISIRGHAGAKQDVYQLDSASRLMIIRDPELNSD